MPIPYARLGILRLGVLATQRPLSHIRSFLPSIYNSIIRYFLRTYGLSLESTPSLDRATETTIVQNPP